MSGILREISASKLSMDLGNQEIVDVQIPASVKYLSTMGKVKPSDFQPGDHITVEVVGSVAAGYTAKSITLNKKGSAEDKTAARAPVISSAQPAPTPPAAVVPVAPPVRTPAPPPLPEKNDGPDTVIVNARTAAFSYSNTLPNYAVKQTTNRYSTIPGKRGAIAWQPLDIVTTELVYLDGKDHYTNTKVNGKPTNHIEQTGSWSEGEFANMLLAVFSPDTKTEFRNQKSVIIRDHPAWRYDYSVALEHSPWILHASGQQTKPACEGSVWIDKSTFRVLRIEMVAKFDRDFPLDTAESSVDYGPVTIGAKEFLLPIDADSLSCTRGTTDCTRDRTEYSEYRKFEADSSITFDEAKPR